MKKTLNKLIWEFIKKTIFNYDLSHNKQIDILYKKLKVYDGVFLDEFRNQTPISKDMLSRMIYDINKLKEGEEVLDYYKRVIDNVAEAIIINECKKLF